MNEQINLNEYIGAYTYDRNGDLKASVYPFNKERCETCKYWEILPVEEQPPAGWGVKGQCNCVHEPKMMTKGYWKTGKTSYCQDYVSKF